MTIRPDKAPRSPGVSGGAAVAIGVALFVALLVLPFGFYAAVLTFQGTPERAGYLVEPISCEVDPESGYTLVELSLEQMSYSDGSPWFERPEAVELIGVSTLAPGSDLASLSPVGRAALLTALQEGEMRAIAHHAPRTTVIALDRTSADTADLDTITLRWSPGEPAFVQHVPLDLRWSGSTCTLG